MRRDRVDESIERLENAVGSLIEAFTDLSERLIAAEAHGTELAELIRAHVGNEEPASFLRSFKRMETENADLRARLAEGRVVVDRTLARLRFLEER